jgi:secondary thiamine-phosphate synthase enzyme
MKSHTEYRSFTSEKQQEIIHITPWVVDELAKSGIQEGFWLVSAMHITASVFINDNESGLHQDILDWLDGDLAPWNGHPARGDDYLHNRTGEDNGAAHLRNLTIGHEVLIPVTDGQLDLGPWQRVFYGEWDGRRPKRVILKIIGE